MSRSILRKKVVRQRTGLSDTTIWRLEKAGDFPSRVQITEAGAVGWYEDEINAWVHDRIRGFGKRPPLANRNEAAWTMRQKQRDPLREGSGSRSTRIAATRPTVGLMPSRSLSASAAPALPTRADNE